MLPIAVYSHNDNITSHLRLCKHFVSLPSWTLSARTTDMTSDMRSAIAAAVGRGVDKNNKKRKRVDEFDLTESTTVTAAPKTPTNAQTPQRTHDKTIDLQSLPDTTVTNAPETPTSARTPQRTQDKTIDLQSLPELASRYIPRYSTEAGVDYVNPQKFCLKPPIWKKWTGREYEQLANELRSQFDPVPFAREHNLPVNEVQQVFSAVVINPLYHAAEAKRRGEAGMQEIMELHNAYGTPNRVWGKPGGKRARGELTVVEEGAVVLALRLSGNKFTMKADELSDLDIKYLVDTLTAEDKCTLWKEAREEAGDGCDEMEF